MIGFYKQRVALIAVPRRDGLFEFGSGYRVTTDAVLTARHLFDHHDAYRKIQVRFLGGGSAWHFAKVRRLEADLDAAFALLDDPPETTTGADPAYGTLVGDDAIKVRGIGFPWAQSEASPEVEERFPEDLPDSRVFPITHSLGVGRSNRYDIQIAGSCPVTLKDAASWAGMSGTAVFAGGRIIGVVTEQPKKYNPDRLVALPSNYLADDRAFREVIGASVYVGAVWAGSGNLNPPFRPLPSDLPVHEQSRATLLLPDYGIVPFPQGVLQADLDDFNTWTSNSRHVSVRILTGPGGSGKTRLAAEVADRMARRGWVAGFYPPGLDHSSIESLVGLTHQRLVVVDDADRNNELVTQLIHECHAAGGSDYPLCLLLVARTVGAWWSGLCHDSAWCQSAKTQTIRGIPETDRRGLFAVAVRAFRQALGIPPKPDVPRLIDLDRNTYSVPLYILIEALRAITPSEDLPDGGHGTTQDPRTELLLWVLDEERKRIWYPTLPKGVAMDPSLVDRLVTIATLGSAQNEEQASYLVGFLPDLCDARALTRGVLARWLHDLYPGDGYLHPLLPDLLGECLAAQTVPDLPMLASQLLSQAPTEQVIRTLSTLLPLAGDQKIADSMRTALRSQLGGLVDALVAVTQRPDALTARTYASELDNALKVYPVPAAAAEIVEGLPTDNYLLAPLAATIAEQSVDFYRGACFGENSATPELARALNNLVNRYRAAGRRSEAVRPAEEAVEIWRSLSGDGDQYLPELASARSNLATAYAQVGRTREAIDPAERAVASYRDAVVADENEHRRTLARFLNNLANRYFEAGRYDEALQTGLESASLFRRLVERRQGHDSASLAMVLNNLASAYDEVDDIGHAVESAEESISIYRELARANPASHIPGLAMALTSIVGILSKVGRNEEAVGFAEEALTLRRQQCQASPAAFTGSLAVALNNVAGIYYEVGRTGEGISPGEESVRIYRQLVASNIGVFTANLAGALATLAALYASADRPADGMRVGLESAALYRKLVAEGSGMFREELEGIDGVVAAVSKTLAALG